VSTFPLVTLNPLGSLSGRARSGHDPLPGSRYQRASALSRAKTCGMVGPPKLSSS
jgi:hypothetical protein